MKKLMSGLLAVGLTYSLTFSSTALAKNPITDKMFTADPAAMVHDGTVYLYTGHDEDSDNKFYKMNDWLLFTSTDMVNWQEHPPIMKVTDFTWAKEHAWAAHMIERDGKFYFYTSVYQKNKKGFAIGVGVADTPYGPFKDARGTALLTNDMTTHTPNDWDDIDPAIYIEDNGDAYMFFGNKVPKVVRLKDNMIELDGDIKVIDLPNFTEALWVHKKGEYYYISYASGFPETIHYAMSKSINGPWEYKGLLNELAGNSETNHQSIIEFKGKDYFIYHNAAIQHNSAIGAGGRYRRSVAVDKLEYNTDGTIKRIVMTSEGITEP